ncbi:hypothetical protein F4212_08695 [Candidatus Poribacteria bacterium]|nr:hypothetical protein [Gammaproteobacteria bacterium]MYF99194.1 hypothetical protein [Candidatus Poribacteria bacterium]
MATLLFGSLARADELDSSDTDLLMIALENETRRITAGHLSLFLYPWQTLKKNAREGDLFLCHLVREAKPLLDPNGYLPRLQDAFQYRSDYMSDIAWAADLGWYLARFGTELNSNLLAKRVLWCIRTILIARSANRRNPIFAPQLLAEQTQSSAGKELLLRRHITRRDAELRKLLRLFLEEETSPDRFNNQADQTAFIERFVVTSNKVALQTIQQEEQSQIGYS